MNFHVIIAPMARGRSLFTCRFAAMVLLCFSILPQVSQASSNTAAQDSSVGPPKNLIILIGDGMGLAHVATAIYSSKEPHPLERFPVTGLLKVEAYNSLVTDSGASATAMSCGVKTYLTGVGVNKDTMPCTNLFEYAAGNDMATGVVLTASFVHATPAGFVAHQPLRGLYENIAIDILDASIDYLVGGGRFFFNERYFDDRNLVEEFEERGYYVKSFDEMSFKRFAKTCHDKAIYFASKVEPIKRIEGRVYLPLAVEHGISCLNRSSENGFLMLVEGSQIDFASHNNDKTYLFGELDDFREAIDAALRFAEADGNTLVIVTADHASGGVTITDGNVEKNKVRIEFSATRHTADMVPIFAYGPGAELFSGMYENTEIFTKISHLFHFEPTETK